LIARLTEFRENSPDSTLVSSYWFVYGALLRQSSILEPKSGE
jgi:hypothetical protein